MQYYHTGFDIEVFVFGSHVQLLSAGHRAQSTMLVALTCMYHMAKNKTKMNTCVI